MISCLEVAFDVDDLISAVSVRYGDLFLTDGAPRAGY